MYLVHQLQCIGPIIMFQTKKRNFFISCVNPKRHSENWEEHERLLDSMDRGTAVVELGGVQVPGRHLQM